MTIGRHLKRTIDYCAQSTVQWNYNKQILCKIFEYYADSFHCSAPLFPRRTMRDDGASATLIDKANGLL